MLMTSWLRQHLAGDPLAVDVGPAVGAQVDDLEAAVRVTAQLSVMPGDIEVPGQRDVVVQLPPDPDRPVRHGMPVCYRAILRQRRDRVRCHCRLALARQGRRSVKPLNLRFLYLSG